MGKKEAKLAEQEEAETAEPGTNKVMDNRKKPQLVVGGEGGEERHSDSVDPVGSVGLYKVLSPGATMRAAAAEASTGRCGW